DRKALASNANDPSANEKIGRFICFLKGDWDAGLPMLAKGSDEQLKAIAALDLSRTGGAERAAVADRWLDHLEKLEPTERTEVRVHAYIAFSQAVPEATGIEKARIG